MGFMSTLLEKDIFYNHLINCDLCQENQKALYLLHSFKSCNIRHIVKHIISYILIGPNATTYQYQNITLFFCLRNVLRNTKLLCYYTFFVVFFYTMPEIHFVCKMANLLCILCNLQVHAVMYIVHVQFCV